MVFSCTWLKVKMIKGNIYSRNSNEPSKYEVFDELHSSEDFLIERIISAGQSTPEGKWLEQDRDEWVVLLDGNARISFEGGDEVELNKGDYIFIPANTHHRVESTSSKPECLWLAVHGKLNTVE